MTASPTDAVPGDVGLPSEEEIAKLISGAPFPSTKSLTKARAILSLIRPAFEAKEREIERACADHANATIGWERERGLREAAEAKLALAVEDEREACAAYLDGRSEFYRGRARDTSDIELAAERLYGAAACENAAFAIRARSASRGETE